jgi:hypothetical protein
MEKFKTHPLFLAGPITSMKVKDMLKTDINKINHVNSKINI